MDNESKMLLAAISTLCGLVTYLWRRLDAAHKETRDELATTRAELQEVRDRELHLLREGLENDDE